MQIADVMSRQMYSVGVHESVVEAARKMRWASLAALPVVDGGRLVGVITERDIVFRAVAEGRAPASVQTREVMGRTLQTCTPDEDIADALLRMEEHAVPHLAVVGRDGAVMGLVSYDELTNVADPDDDEPDAELVKLIPSYRRTPA